MRDERCGIAPAHVVTQIVILLEGNEDLKPPKLLLLI